MSETIKNFSTPTIKKIKGDYHVGDIFTTVNNYNSKRRKLQFETVTTTAEVFNDYPKPHFLDAIFSKARTEQIVLIGGNSGFNKGQLLKYVAVNLKTDGLEVKECADFEDFYSLSAAIQEEANRTIFILYNLTAEAINFRFGELKMLTRKKDHIILCSTEDTYDAWMFNETIENPCWFQVPEKGLYSKETLTSYLDTAIQKKQLTLPITSEEAAGQLSKIEHIDVFLDLLVKSDKKTTREAILVLLELSTRDDYSNLGPWFYSLNRLDKLIVIGLSLFDGAYEAQVFAGFERILHACWRQRNKEIQSIDYEDLIPLRAYFKTEGKVIQGTFEHQRKKIIQLAWRTHKRYLLTAIPELLEIIQDSANWDKYDPDLFASHSYRTRIRNVLSDTLSDIGLQSFEDVNRSLMSIASRAKMSVQMVTAMAISRWKLFDENKIYEVLEIWQQDTATGLLERADPDDKKEKDERTLLSNVRGAIALTLYFTSYYDKSNNLSPRITDLLIKFLDNDEGAIVDRMQYAVEHITARHPLSMSELLKSDFLQHPYYIGPVSNGLTAAYNNGMAQEVKEIIIGWLAYCKGLTDNTLDRDQFGHRESILSAIIYTLKFIDYNTEHKTISIGESHSILDELRKSNHNTYIRNFLLDAIVQLIEDSFHSTEKITIKLISNIDAKERENVVNGFREKYLTQRQELKGGDYYTKFDKYQFDTWSQPDSRPKTPIEDLLNEWKNGADTVLTQIALQSFVEFHAIESTEKDLINELLNNKDKDEREWIKKRSELERNGLQAYEGEIKGDIETEAFVKICTPYIDRNKLSLLKNMYTVAVHKNLEDDGANDLISHLEDNGNAKRNILFIYKIFRNGKFKPKDNPAKPSLGSRLLVTMSLLTVPSQNIDLLRAFAPFIISTDSLSKEERSVIFYKIKSYKQGWLRTSFILAKYPYLFIPMIMLILYIISKIF